MTTKLSIRVISWITVLEARRSRLALMLNLEMKKDFLVRMTERQVADSRLCVLAIYLHIVIWGIVFARL
jgi:hypothetical protein